MELEGEISGGSVASTERMIVKGTRCAVDVQECKLFVGVALTAVSYLAFIVIKR